MTGRWGGAITYTLINVTGLVLVYIGLVYLFPDLFGQKGKAISTYVWPIGEGFIWVAYEGKFVLGLLVGLLQGYLRGWKAHHEIMGR